MKTRKHFIPTLLAALGIGLPLWKGAVRAQPLPRTDDEIKALLDKCVLTQRRAPAIVVAIIETNATRVFSKVHDPAGPKIDGDSLFEIGSVTKTFTALLLQEMVDAGEVRLDDPIDKYLPASVRAPTRNGRQITLVDLATQTSGLPRLPGNLSPKDGANPYADYTVDQLYDFLSHFQLKRDIGSKYEYSNLGVGLLGHVLALRAGTNYEALVVSRVCDPLGMNSTRIALSRELQSRLAPGHNRAGIPVENWDIPTLAGCGALRSTANDLAKFVAANMGSVHSPLSQAMRETHEPRRAAGRGEKIGLIWMTDSDTHTIWHNGGTYGYHSYVGFKADGSRGVVILANSENDVDDLGHRLLGDRDDLEDFASPRTRKIAQIDPGIFDDFVGQYQFSGAPVIITMTREGDHLFGQMTGQSRIEFYPETETDVFCTVVDAQMTFVKDGFGKVTHLILHQNGIDQKVTKIK